MRHQILAATALIASAGPALAHPGHLQDGGGHTHWLALAAVSFAGLIALAGVVRGLRRHMTEAQGRTAGQK
jgi:hypothetical protein